MNRSKYKYTSRKCLLNKLRDIQERDVWIPDEVVITVRDEIYRMQPEIESGCFVGSSITKFYVNTGSPVLRSEIQKILRNTGHRRYCSNTITIVWKILGIPRQPLTIEQEELIIIEALETGIFDLSSLMPSYWQIFAARKKQWLSILSFP